MAAAIGSHGVARFGGGELPKPSAVVMAYTAHSDHSSNEPPTFVVVGEQDGIAPPSTMERRVATLRNAGTEVAYRRYRNLGHGFGTGDRDQRRRMAGRRRSVLGSLPATERKRSRLALVTQGFDQHDESGCRLAAAWVVEVVPAKGAHQPSTTDTGIFGHGFGPGTGTSAEGWLADGIKFWAKFIRDKN